MAKSSRRRAKHNSSRWPWFFVAVIGVLLLAAWHWSTPALGYARTAAAYSARVACSCHYVAGRSMDDCAKDKLAGMELVTLVDDPRARTVTARFPLLASDSATYRKGEGCYLARWKD